MKVGDTITFRLADGVGHEVERVGTIVELIGSEYYWVQSGGLRFRLPVNKSLMDIDNDRAD